LDLAATCALVSAFKTSGQRCVSAGRILVHEKIFDRFADKLVQAAKRIKVGNPLDAANFTGPVINQTAVEKISRYNELAKKEGAQILLDGGRMTDAEHAGGNFLAPFVYRQKHQPGGIRTIREEVFGPHLALIPFRN